MHCYICDRETNNLRRDPDGKLVSICHTCLEAIRDCNRKYEDINEEDLKLSKMSGLELIKYIERKDKKNGK